MHLQTKTSTLNEKFIFKMSNSIFLYKFAHNNKN